MSYIGRVEQKASDIRRFNVTGSTSATHTLTWSPPNEQSLIITINGVKQQEDAYSVSGTTLTLTSALVSTDKMEVVGILDIGESSVPANDSITNAMVKSDAAIAKSKLASLDIVDADVNASAAITQSKLSLDITNSEVNASAAIALSKLATDPSNASNLASGTVPTARLGSGTASSSTFLRGDQSWASAGEVLTDFCRISAQSTFTSLVNNTLTTLAFDTTDFDVHGSMANLANNRIDIKTAGYYVVGGGLHIGAESGNESRYVWVNQYDNSASASVDGIAKQNITQTSHSGAQWLSCMTIIQLGVDDYLTLQGFSNGGSGPSTQRYELYCGRIK